MNSGLEFQISWGFVKLFFSQDLPIPWWWVNIHNWILWYSENKKKKYIIAYTLGAHGHCTLSTSRIFPSDHLWSKYKKAYHTLQQRRTNVFVYCTDCTFLVHHGGMTIICMRANLITYFFVPFFLFLCILLFLITNSDVLLFL